MSKEAAQLKYLNLGHLSARGGGLRFFMLAHGIQYEEELYGVKNGEWAAKKKEMVDNGKNAAGTVPILETDGKTFTQHIAIMRYLAKSRELVVGDTYAEFVQDAVADEYHTLRNAWASSAFGDEETKAKFKTEVLGKELTVLNGLYKLYKQNEVFLSVGRDEVPLWGDVAVFALIYDLLETGFMTLEDLKSYSELSPMYLSLKKLPAVAQWIQAKKPSSA